ncbi:MAG: MBL fold metallo-hydrolase [Gemmatimonadaceae bacterium]|nr:MBL fold metallo-hydrolase [Gemmatimonadaceae bacterium]NUR34914.1 MBL fold metallo-hydrolase [Gemmatimonadaceae bacterium]NUS97190.1 MBL fold metallo-hydrolase [Gemmatimonadaceae bacterium]
MARVWSGVRRVASIAINLRAILRADASRSHSMMPADGSTDSPATPPSGAASHHTDDGHFRNPWPGSRPKGFGAVLRWSAARAVRRLRGESAATSVALPMATPAVANPREESGALRATWVGHSTTLLQLGRTNVLVDPIWSDRASPVPWAGPRRLVPPALPFEGLPPLDVVLLSHDHYDHLDAPTVKRLAAAHPGARWVAPLGVGRRITALGVPQVVELDWWESTRAALATVTATPAQHFSGRGPGDRDTTLWAGFAIAADGWRVFYAGDTGYHPEFPEIGRRLGPLDLAVMPIGAYEPRWFMRPVHMNAEEAVDATVDLASAGQAPPPMLGVHWGTFRLTDEPTDEPPRRAARAWAVRGLPVDRCWILRHGETRVVPPRAGGDA